MIHQTKRKLREARFFFDHLNEENSISSDPENFSFYLSAFLSASRSVQDVLRAEFIQSAENSAQKEKRRPWYNDWFPKWEDGLGPDDNRYWEFANVQRQAEIHEQGAEAQLIPTYVPLIEIRADSRGHPAYGHHHFAPPGTPPPKVKQTVPFFEIDANKEEVIKVCERYLALCEKLVADFEHDATSADI